MEIADPPKQRVQAAARPIGGMPGGRGVGRGAMPLGNSQGGAAGLAASLMQRLQQAQTGPGAQQQPAATQVRGCRQRVLHAGAAVVMPLLRPCGSFVSGYSYFLAH
jgi:hypothetical protein